MAFEIKTTGHSVAGLSHADVHSFASNRSVLRLVLTGEVHSTYYPSMGVHVVAGNIVIGWIPKAFFEEYESVLRNNFGLKRIGDECLAKVSEVYMQNTGKPGLSLRYMGDATQQPAGRVPPPNPISKKPVPQPEAESKMKLPTLQELINTNAAAIGTATQLETGRVANKQLVKIISKKLKPEHAALLNNPIGQALLANAVIVLAKSLQPDNATLKKISNAMLVTSLQELLAGFDIPGMIDELLNSPDVLKAALKEAEGTKGKGDE